MLILNEGIEKRTILKSIVSDTTIIIGIATFISYIFAYRFEAGRKGFYHIPDKLTELNLLSIIRPSYSFVISLIIVIAALICYFLFAFLVAFILDKYIINKIFTKRIFNLKDFPFFLKFILIAIFLAILMSFNSQVYNYGKLHASNEVDFLTVEREGTVFAVIDTYNNNFIVVPIDIEKSTFKSEYKFINPVDEKIQFKRVVLENPLHEE